MSTLTANPSHSGSASPDRVCRSPVASAALWALFAVALVLGTIGLIQRVMQGHLPAGYGSYVPWGLWVALYFHGVGMAGGAFLIGAGGYVLGLPGFRSKAVLRAVIVLSFAAILPAFMGIWLDLGHPFRSHHIFTSPSFTSMMAFNSWMYGVFMVIAAVAWLLSFRERTDWLKPVLCLGLLFTILFPSQSGAFFGVVDAKPYWHSSLLPVLFLVSAVVTGGAALLVVRALLGVVAADEAHRREHLDGLAKLRLVVLVALGVYFVMEFAEFSVALWNPTTHAPALELVLWGPYWWMFWMVHLLLGGVVAVALLASPRPWLWALGGAVVAVAMVSGRLNILVPGQAVGEIQGLQDAFQHDRLSYVYHATVMEYLVAFFLLALGMAIFFIGQRISTHLAARTGASD